MAELATQFGAEHIASTVRSTAERVSEGRFYVACVGQFKRGKSTLLNALIGHSVLPTAVVPVTAVPTIIRHGQRLAARVRFQSATWTDIPVGTVDEFVSEEKNPENSKGVVGVEIFVPSPLLETGMCLVDTPGLGSVFAGNTAATQAFIPHFDAAIFVIGTDPPLSGDELQLVEAISREIHDLVFVLNKADRVNAAERTAASDFARRVLEARIKQISPVILEVSALERLGHRGPERDWGKLIHALEDLVLHSGRSLVGKPVDRGIRRAANQLLALIKEERVALERPLEESDRRIAALRETLEESESRTRDLGILLTAEQQRLSGVFIERRNVFLKQAQAEAHSELTARLSVLRRSHHGPAYRRNVNRVAQEISRAQLTPWLGSETRFADEEFRKTAKRFVELANEFLQRLEETGVPGLESLPEDIQSGQTLSAKSQFHFHVIERIAAPASPLLFISDLVVGSMGLRGAMVRDAREFLDQLLEVNSARVQSDVDERVRESRKKLEKEIKGALREASSVADRALTRARMAHAAGTSGVEAALARLAGVELELRGIIPSKL
jgi:GTP-binding protein EngB required for normal cell division